MEYPKKFVRDCKQMFPSWNDLNDALDCGSPNVGKYLCDACVLRIDEDMIISAFRNKKEEKILKIAERTKKIRKLYQQWFYMMNKYEVEIAEENGYLDCI